MSEVKKSVKADPCLTRPVAVDLQLEAWTPLLGHGFQVTPAEGPAFHAVLKSVEPTPYGDPSTYAGRKMPFSLLFAAEDGTLVPQQICALAHAEHGDTDLFLVPLGPEDGAMRYEAVIS